MLTDGLGDCTIFHGLLAGEINSGPEHHHHDWLRDDQLHPRWPASLGGE